MLRALDPRRVISGGSDAAEAVGAFEDEARVRCGDDRVRREVVGDELRIEGPTGAWVTDGYHAEQLFVSRP